MEGFDNLKKTPLFEIHQKYGGRIIDFGGWALPVQYTSIVEEHRAVREAAGLFDVSHMGEILVTGPQALAFLQKAVTNDVSRLVDNQIQYSPMCYENGGTVDDLLIYRFGLEEFLLVVNAANKDKDFAWLTDLARGFSGVLLSDISSQWAELALQGPRAEAILQGLTNFDLKEIKYYWFRAGVDVKGVRCLVSRTGYTGEDGFEMYCAPGDAAFLWEALMERGEEQGLVPAGLGARDTLRFEARMPLYGHELDENTSPLEAGLGSFVSFDKGDFVGRAALLEQKEKGLKKKLVGFEMIDRGIPRAHYPILKEGREVGYVTTGSFSPTLEKNIGLGYVPPQLARVGTELEIGVRGKGLKAVVVKTPFYRRG